MDIVQIAPRQLRIVGGGDWSIPVHCDPYTTDGREVSYWRVAPAMELLAGPFEELSSLFSPVNQADTKRYWIVPDDFVVKTTKKVDGCLPEDYLNWMGEGSEQAKSGTEKVSDLIVKDDPFMRYVCKSSGMDPVLGRYFWAAMKKCLVKWLVQEQRPVAFGPFTVHPMPYRANWKEIMLAKHGACHRSFFRLKAGKQLRKALIEDGFVQDLGSVDLLAMDKGKFVWSLDIEMQPVLDKAFREAEVSRLSTKRQARYARYYEGCIRRRLDDILEVFQKWLHQLKAPVGRLSESPVSGSPILLSQTKRSRVLPSWHSAKSVGFMGSADNPTLKAGQPQPRAVSGKTKKLFELSGVLPGAEDVRECAGPAVSADGERGDGGSGVLLLDAAQGEVTGSPVLDKGDKS